MFIKDRSTGSLVIVLTMLLASCASERTITKTKVDVDAFGREHTYSVGKDADGNPQMKSDKRSMFDGKSSNVASKGLYDGKDYAKSSYRTARWGGDSTFKTKQYGGERGADGYDKEPWFVRKQAQAQGKTAGAEKKSFMTKLFSTKSSRTNSTPSSITHQSDAETNVRRRVFIQPDIISFKESAELNVSDTNRLLGR